MSLLEEKVIQSKEVKKLIDFLIKESNYNHTEFRLVVQDDGNCYAHVQDRDSTTINFKLPDYRSHH